MSLTLPRVVQRPSPNYSPTPIRPDLLVLHMMEGGYEGSVAWLCLREAGASAHLCMREDGAEVSQLVPLGLKAWAQCAFNGRAISLEIPGFTAKGIPIERWRAAALIFAWISLAYHIPVQWAKSGEGRGLCQHHDLGPGGGGHGDCSDVGSPEWLAFLDMTRAARAELAKGPLPPFALHGLPNPAQTELPADAAPTPSHGGATRSSAADGFGGHGTGSGFPHGSVADLQWRLNAGGAQPRLAVDGLAGEETRAALRAFQGRHGLLADGLAGPATWAALDAPA